MSNPSRAKKIVVPRILTLKYIDEFLNQAEIIFFLENKELQDYQLDLSRLRKTNVLGMLLVYKIIEFSVEKKCFQNPRITVEDYIDEKWNEYQFLPLIEAYVTETDSESKFKNLKIQLTEKFILAPQPLLRDSDFTHKYLKNNLLPKIKEYYNNEEKVISMIFTCFSEILLNFWEHAVQDTKSIMIADGNKTYMEIACADTGSGIISTLKRNQKYSSLSNEEILLKSVQKDVTSKELTNHMGFGLWIIDKIISEINGRMSLISEGYHYSNERGKVSVKKTGFWKGTIVYLALPINNPKSLYDIEIFRTKEMDNIKIDFR